MNLPVFMSFAKRDFCDERTGKMQDQRVNAAVQAEARSRYQNVVGEGKNINECYAGWDIYMPALLSIYYYHHH